MSTDAVVGAGLLPDFLTRLGIRRLIRERQRSLYRGAASERSARERAFIEALTTSPVAIHQDAANAQHYEVPPRFFELVLGRNLKYSCAFFEPGDTLDMAEGRMLGLTAARAQLGPDQDILELGCGWGSLTLFMAERFPTARILALSNSGAQREFILERARARNLTNIQVETADISHWEPPRAFDRVVSVEMFEHLRNWPLMFRRVSGWLEPQGRFFLHVFTHREYSYPFVDEGDGDFMARHFFTGGMMPSDTLALAVRGDLQLEEHVRIPGGHYAKTATAWLANMDAHRREIEVLFKQTYGPEAGRFWHYWRAFFMACEQLWSFDQGRQWIVSHYRFRRD